MSRRGSVGAVAAVVLSAMTLAACGGGSGSGSGPSALDPANKVPDTALVYMSLAVRPQGALGTNLAKTIDGLAGKGASHRLVAELERKLSSGGVLDQLQSWFGRRIGVALTGIPPKGGGTQALIDDLLFVVPTTNPSAAKSFLTSHFNGPDESGQVVGDYAIFGGQAAVGAALATTGQASLGGDVDFKSDISQLGPDQFLTFFGRDRQLLDALIQTFTTSGAQPGSAQPLTALRKLPPSASFAVGLSVPLDEFRLDIVTQGLPKSATSSSAQSSDVGSLPGNSWLALALSLKDTNELSTSLHGLAEAGGGAAASQARGFLPFLERDVLPALGPMSLSLAGTSRRSLRVGFELTPPSSAAGDRLVAALKRMISGHLTATTAAGHVVLTSGYPKSSDLLSPVSRLSQTATYRAAAAQLPAGSHVPIYIDFAPLELVAKLSKGTSSASAARVLGKLNYLIAGGTRTHFRIVLAVR